MLAKRSSPTATDSGHAESACTEFSLPAAAGLRLGGGWRSDLELGGTDQKFNVANGRDLKSLSASDPSSVEFAADPARADGWQKMSKEPGQHRGPVTTRSSMYSKLGETARCRWWNESLTLLHQG